MKTIKIKLLGSEYEINCEEKDIAKINNLAFKLNNRVIQLSGLNNNHTDAHKLLMASIYLEDKVNDLISKQKETTLKLEDYEKKNIDHKKNYDFENEKINEKLESVSKRIKNILLKISNEQG